MATKNITVPDIGGATDVDVIEVLVKVGDHVKVDTPLVTLESDKATMEVPSTDEGVVKELKLKVGDKVSQGSVILSVRNMHKRLQQQNRLQQKQTQPRHAEPVAAKASAPAPVAKQTEPASEKEAISGTVITAGYNANVHAGPAVRKLAREFGVDLNQVAATGPKQRILKRRCTSFCEIATSLKLHEWCGRITCSTCCGFCKIWSQLKCNRLSRIKKLSGKNLHRNWLLVPHVTQFGEADITELEEFRQAQKSVTEKQGIKLTPLVFIMKAVVAALKAFPEFNASLDATAENLVMKNYFHIGVAVDTPDGLVVPVIRDVDKKGLMDLAKELAIVSEKARNKQLTANDMQGGSFSISSLGGIGGTAFTPIVNFLKWRF